MGGAPGTQIPPNTASLGVSLTTHDHQGDTFKPLRQVVSSLQKQKHPPGVVTQTCNPSTGEVEAGGL
jgi:hypothetical protein